MNATKATRGFFDELMERIRIQLDSPASARKAGTRDGHRRGSSSSQAAAAQHRPSRQQLPGLAYNPLHGHSRGAAVPALARDRSRDIAATCNNATWVATHTAAKLDVTCRNATWVTLRKAREVVLDAKAAHRARIQETQFARRNTTRPSSRERKAKDCFPAGRFTPTAACCTAPVITYHGSEELKGHDLRVFLLKRAGGAGNAEAMLAANCAGCRLSCTGIPIRGGVKGDSWGDGQICGPDGHKVDPRLAAALKPGGAAEIERHDRLMEVRKAQQVRGYHDYLKRAGLSESSIAALPGVLHCEM